MSRERHRRRDASPQRGVGERAHSDVHGGAALAGTRAPMSVKRRASTNVDRQVKTHRLSMQSTSFVIHARRATIGRGVTDGYSHRFALGPTPITTEDDDGGETGSAKHERGTRRGSLCVHAHRHDVARECIG